MSEPNEQCNDARCCSENPHYHCPECDAAVEDVGLCRECRSIGDDWQ